MDVIILLSVVVVAQTIVLVVVLVRRAHSPMASVTQDDVRRALLKIESVQSKLTFISWSIDMLLKKEQGDISLAQKEALHQMLDECGHAAEQINGALADLHCVVSSTTMLKTV